VKAKQLPLFGPIDWDFKRKAHQLLGGELRWILAVDNGAKVRDAVRRRMGKPH